MQCLCRFCTPPPQVLEQDPHVVQEEHSVKETRIFIKKVKAHCNQNYGRLSFTGLKWRRTKEPLLFRLGLANEVLLSSLCSFVLWTLIILDPVYERPGKQ